MSVYGVVVVGAALDAAARREVAALAQEMSAQQGDVQQAAREAAAQARMAADEARAAARAFREGVHPQLAGQAVAQDPSALPPVLPEAPGAVPRVSMGPDGKMTVISPDGSTAILERSGRYTVINARGQVTQSSPSEKVLVQGIPGGAVVSMILVNALLAFFAGRLWAGRKFRRGMATNPALAPGVGDRMERIEQAVEAIAIEVERVSEGQRFTTRLLSEQLRSPVPVAAGVEQRA